jgi:hypothetical protein
MRLTVLRTPDMIADFRGTGIVLSLKSPRSRATSAFAFELGLPDTGFCLLPLVIY